MTIIRSSTQSCPARFSHLGVGVAEDPSLGVLGQKGQNPLLAATAFGKVVLFHQRILPVEGDGMEVKIEGTTSPSTKRGPLPHVKIYPKGYLLPHQKFIRKGLTMGSEGLTIISRFTYFVKTINLSRGGAKKP